MRQLGLKTIHVRTAPGTRTRGWLTAGHHAFPVALGRGGILANKREFYREQGWYLERMYKWCDRVGLDAIRKQVVDDVANRKALVSRFAYSQQFSQSDPWAARAKRGVDRNEFTPLAELELA